MSQAENAKRILSNYFYNLSIASGLNWTRDNDSDISFAVDDIIKTVLEKLEDQKNVSKTNVSR